VGSRTLTPLAEQLATGQHFRWSGDGTALVYATSYCSLKVAAGDSDTTVPVQTTGETGADSPDTADAVVDTVTGDVVPLPVAGSVVGAFFNPDGNLLVRSRKGTRTTLWLL